MTGRKGFSLVEIMIAVGVLGVVIVTICGVFLHGLHAIKKGRYRAAALHIANQKYSELNNLDWSNPAGIPTDKLSQPPPDGVIEGWTSFSHGDPYIRWDNIFDEYEIRGMQNMAGIDYNFYIFIKGEAADLKMVTVRVKWKEIEDMKKVELCTLIARKI